MGKSGPCPVAPPPTHPDMWNTRKKRDEQRRRESTPDPTSWWTGPSAVDFTSPTPDFSSSTPSDFTGGGGSSGDF